MLGDQHRVDAVRRRTRSRISAPAPITSARPGCMNGIAPRSARVMASSRLVDSRTRSAGDLWWMDRRGRTPGGRARSPRSWSPCRRRRQGRPASPAVDAAAVEGRVDVARPPRPPRRSAGRRRRWRSVIRTEPMSSDSRRRSAVAVAEDELGGAAADVDRRGTAPGSAGGQRAGRAGEGQRGLLVAADAPPGATPSRPATPAANSSALAASRVGRGGAEADRSGRRASRISPAYSSTAANVRSSAAVGEPSGAVDALAEPDHAHLADERRIRPLVAGRGRRSAA